MPLSRHRTHTDAPDAAPLRFRALEGALTELREAERVFAKEAALRPVERQLARDLRRAFIAQGRAFMRAFARYRQKFVEPQRADRPLSEAEEPETLVTLSAGDLNRAFTASELSSLRAFLVPLRRAQIEALRSGAQSGIADLRLSLRFDLKNPRAVEYLRENGAQKVTRINQTTRASIQRIVTQAVEEGWSYNRTAKEIRTRYEDFAMPKPQQHIRDRAELVAVTEAANAYEEGNRIVGEDLRSGGLAMEKSWLTVGDDRVSPGCSENESAGWLPFDGDFPAGGGTYDRQRPPRFPGCRCTMLLRQAEDAVSVTDAGTVEPEDLTKLPVGEALDKWQKTPEGRRAVERAKRLPAERAALQAEFDRQQAIMDANSEAAWNVKLDQTEAEIEAQRAANKAFFDAKAERDKAWRAMKELNKAALPEIVGTETGVTLKSRITKATSKAIGKEEWDGAVAELGGLLSRNERTERLLTQEIYARKSRRGRSSCEWDGSAINLSSGAGRSTFLHELGHWLEAKVPAYGGRAVQFLKYRTEGETDQRLRDIRASHHASHEVARPDQFYDSYTGRMYRHQGVLYATEITSMGLDALAEDPAAFAERDPEHFAFTVALLRGEL